MASLMLMCMALDDDDDDDDEYAKILWSTEQ